MHDLKLKHASIAHHLQTDGYFCSVSSITSVISNKYFIHGGLCIGSPAFAKSR